MAETKRQRFEKLRAQLVTERSYIETDWRDVGDYLLPHMVRFQTSDARRSPRGNRRKILRNTAGYAVRTLRAGMHAGMTSPARPWFRLTTPDPALAEFGPVKRWLDLVRLRMSWVFYRSNLYNVLPQIYASMAGFGTSAAVLLPDEADVMRGYFFPVGSYWLATDGRLKINTMVREYPMTVRQLVETFGGEGGLPLAPGRPIRWENFSLSVKTSWENSRYEEKRDVCHVLAPNAEHDPRRALPKFKRFASCYYEKAQENEQKFLRESGFDLFNVLGPRWETTGSDVYGSNCPGFEAIGDIKQLQKEQSRKLEGIEKQVRPPMQAPTALANKHHSTLPGDFTYMDVRADMQGMKPVYEVKPDLQGLKEDIAEQEYLIRRAFYEDLFLLLASDPRNREMTAREVAERHEEKLIVLGPTLEQTNQDLLDPMIELAFEYMLRRDEGSTDPILPPPPQELEGTPLRVEYISILAQAQKLVGLSAIDRTVTFAANLAQAQANAGMAPTAFHKVNVLQAVDEYADMTGVSPSVVRTDEEVDEILRAEAEARAQAARMEAVQAGAKSARDLAGADMSGDNALTRLAEEGRAGSLVPA